MLRPRSPWLRLALIEILIVAAGLGSLLLLDYALDAALDADLIAAGLGLAAD